MGYGQGNIVRQNKKEAAAPATVTAANNGLSLSGTTVQLGGPLATPSALLNDRYIDGGAFKIVNTFNSLAGNSGFTLSSNSTLAAGGAQRLLNVSLSGTNATASQPTYGIYSSNTHGGTLSTNYGVYGEAIGATQTDFGVYGNTSAGFGVYGNSGSGAGVAGASASSYGVSAASGTGIAGKFTVAPSTTNTVIEVMELNRIVLIGTPANGIGGFLGFHTMTSNGSTQLSNQVISKWTDATNATRTSQMIFTGVNSAVTGDILTLNGNKSIKFNGYGGGAITGVAAFIPAFTSSGDIIEIAVPGGGGIATADNGLTLSTATNVQLGQPIATVGNPAALLASTEIPLGLFTFSIGTNSETTSLQVDGNGGYITLLANHQINGRGSDRVYFETASSYIEIDESQLRITGQVNGKICFFLDQTNDQYFIGELAKGHLTLNNTTSGAGPYLEFKHPTNGTTFTINDNLKTFTYNIGSAYFLSLDATNNVYGIGDLTAATNETWLKVDDANNKIITKGDSYLRRTETAFTNGAAAQVATMTNGPAAGNPTKWIPIDDNGVTRYIPAW